MPSCNYLSVKFRNFALLSCRQEPSFFFFSVNILKLWRGRQSSGHRQIFYGLHDGCQFYFDVTCRTSWHIPRTRYPLWFHLAIDVAVCKSDNSQLLLSTGMWSSIFIMGFGMCDWYFRYHILQIWDKIYSKTINDLPPPATPSSYW